jgi:hypothetical protein
MTDGTLLNKLVHSFVSSSTSNDHDKINGTIDGLSLPTDERLTMECRTFLPNVFDTWMYIERLSIDTARFRHIYELFRYERIEQQRQVYSEQMKRLDENIYKHSLTIHQCIQTLEKHVQPMFDDFHCQQTCERSRQTVVYRPVSIRIAENQLSSLKITFKRLVLEHNSNSFDYQHDLRYYSKFSTQSMNSNDDRSRWIQPTTTYVDNNNDDNVNMKETDVHEQEQQIQMSIDEQDRTVSKQELELVELQERLENIRILKDRVRQMK